MKYMGSKAKFAKEILPIILHSRTSLQSYVEPFVGSCNMIDKVGGIRIACDNNKYLIALWKGLQEGRTGIMQISHELFSEARVEYNNNTNIKFDDFEIGWIGFMAGFNGRFFGGGYSGSHKGRNYLAEQIKNTLRQVKKIKNITFYCCNYDELIFPENSIMYCDPPYMNTKEYDVREKFNHEKFWEWCRQKSKSNLIYISEYNAPSDFECVWARKTNVSLCPDKTLPQTEKLFTINNNQKQLKLF